MSDQQLPPGWDERRVREVIAHYEDQSEDEQFAEIEAARERRTSMPVIARFYGILIKMYFREHGVPHFHAIYGEFNGVFDANTLEMIEGDLPNRAIRMVKEWARKHQAQLIEMWGTQEYRQIPGLK